MGNARIVLPQRCRRRLRFKNDASTKFTRAVRARFVVAQHSNFGLFALFVMAKAARFVRKI
jgi:hypothetical protein